jgi:hypothetical protein
MHEGLTVQCFNGDLIAVGEHLGCDIGLELSVRNHYGNRPCQTSFEIKRGVAYIPG